MQQDFRDESWNVVRSTNFGYGNEGEPTYRVGSSEYVVLGYDAAYHNTTVQNGNGKVTTNAYDLDGNLTQVSYPRATGTNYDQIKYTSYDPVGNLLSRIDGEGHVTTYTYGDGDGLLSNVAYTGSSSEDVAVVSDDYDRMTSLTNGTAQVGYHYNDADYVDSTTQQFFGTTIPVQTTSYVYWPDGQRRSMTDLAGTWTYDYDAAGRYVQLVSPAGASQATYQDNDWQSSRSLPNGTSAAFQYNAAGLPTRVTNWTGTTQLSDYQATSFDGALEMTGVSASVPFVTGHSGTLGFGYDGNGRLTSESSTQAGGYSYTHSYDGAGNAIHNRLSTETYNDDDQLNTGTSLYDGNGSPNPYYVSQSYDRENRLNSIGSAFSAAYGPDGSRAWKSAGSSAPKTYFLYDGADPVAELDSTGAVKAINVFAPDGLVGRKQTGAWTYFQYDLQGNAVQRTNAGGAITTGAAYDAYGYMSLSGVDDQPFAYNARWGYYRDLELGTYFCQNRYYDPLGRWMTRDPIGFAGGMNLYAYCGGNLVGRIDPQGTNFPGSDPSGGGVGGAIEGLIEDEIGLIERGGGVNISGVGIEPMEIPGGPGTPGWAPEVSPAGSTPQLTGELPPTYTSLNESYPGRYHDFTDCAVEDVNIEPTGTRWGDRAAANRASGRAGSDTPDNMVWHHHVERGRMQLVPQSIHGNIGHWGGWSIWGKFGG